MPVPEVLEQRVGFVEPASGSSELSYDSGDARSAHERPGTILSSAPGQGDARDAFAYQSRALTSDHARGVDPGGERT